MREQAEVPRSTVTTHAAASQPLISSGQQRDNYDADTRQQPTLADRIGRIKHAMTAEELAEMLTVSTITIYKKAKANRIPSFHVGTCVRFDPRTIADWLRKQ